MNLTVERLIKESSSPFYLFDIKELKRRVSYLKNNLPDSVSLCYAIKANPFLVRELADSVERFELCSPGEVNICAKAGVPYREMVVSGIYKTPSIIEEMVAKPEFDGIITVESIHQYHMLCHLAERYDRSINVFLRLTNNSQFGINKEDIISLIREQINNRHICLNGIQYFSGTQKTSIKKFKRELQMLDELLIYIRESCGVEIEELEYGPGFPVAYFFEENLDEENLLSEFSMMLDSMVSKPKLTLELGRSIVASCGTYYTHIVDLKNNSGQNYAIIDGGMHQITYYGQSMAMKLPLFYVVGKQNDKAAGSWAVCGSICSMNDILAKNARLPELSIGDTLCFCNAGAYCMTEGASLFLSRDLPAVYIIDEQNNLVCIRPTFETEQLNTPVYERS